MYNNNYNNNHPRSYHNPNHTHLTAAAATTRRLTQSCPVALSTYATLHMDTTAKILNHVVAVTVLCDIFLLFSSFSVAYLDHHVGFNTVLCSFLLGACSVVVLLIINNSRISALSILAPTEFMIGLAMGLTIGAAVLAAVLSSTYRTGIVCDKRPPKSSSWNRRGSNTTSYHAAAQYDSSLADTCANHARSMTAIWFWAGLVAWLNVVTALLIATGRHELSLHHQGGQYETIGSNDESAINDNNQTRPPSTFDFEESFRRQQQEILGAQQAAAVRDRAAAMFVGDYTTVPEVTDGGGGGYQQQSNASTASRQTNGEAMRILSV